MDSVPLPPEGKAMLANHVFSFYDFNILEFEKYSRGRTLRELTMFVLRSLGCLEQLRIPEDSLERYLALIEAHYRENAYHNAVHAADVVQTIACVLKEGMKSFLQPIEVFGVVLAAAVHDVAHPGFNNDFHVRTRSREAEEYNNLSPNENMHAKKAVDHALEPGMDFMENLTDHEVEELHKIMRSAILSTDMKYHMDFLARFTLYLDTHGEDPSRYDAEGRLIVMQMALKVADIINPARKVGLAVEWGRRVMEEMYRQGDLEIKLGLEVSPICDRAKNRPSAAQLFFIDKVLRPSLYQWGRINRLGEFGLDCLKATEEFWRVNGEAEDSYILNNYQVASFKSDDAPKLPSSISEIPGAQRPASPCRSSLYSDEGKKATGSGGAVEKPPPKTGSLASDTFSHVPSTLAGRKPSVIADRLADNNGGPGVG